MLILVSGGASSGKSAFAEELIVRSGLKERIYLATMQVWDKESERRVERHRAMRAGKGFATLERPLDLAGLPLPPGSAVLLEDLTNLTANEYFGPQGPKGALERLTAGPAGGGHRRALLRRHCLRPGDSPVSHLSGPAQPGRRRPGGTGL